MRDPGARGRNEGSAGALHPSLLERLTDQQPGARVDAPAAGGVSPAMLRDSVRRELSFLLNTTCLGAVTPLDGVPEVQRSTLNYGIVDLAGRAASTVDRVALARVVKQAINRFEPRLLADSVKVEATVDKDAADPNGVRLEIEADLWGEPTPLRLRWAAHLDLEDGHARIDSLEEG